MNAVNKEVKPKEYMKDVKADVVSVQTLLSEDSLNIPAYQRPYKWQEQHVNQLLDDLILHRDKGRYRLGTVLLHQHDGTQDKPSGEIQGVDTQAKDPTEKNSDQGKKVLDIVDGQQRLLTITLIGFLLCQAIDPKMPPEQYPFKSPLLEKGFSASVSQANLRHNAAVIQSRLGTLSFDELDNLLKFLKNSCELVVVMLFELSEAFQFFDSQNSRGKSLAPHDLLKAFHLREMSGDESKKLACVQAWEAGIEPKEKSEGMPELHRMMSLYLYPIRCWVRGESGLGFDKDRIDVFKGVNLERSRYPWAESLRSVDYVVSGYNSDRIRNMDQQAMIFPFQLDQPLINGQRFFEFIRYYFDLWARLFIQPPDELKPLKAVLESTDYQGRNRTGDIYVRDLFYCAVLYYYDRFGEAELERAAKLCFKWAFRIRIGQKKVMQQSVDNAARANDSLFRVISHARHPIEVLGTYVEMPAVQGTKIEALKTYFELKTEDNTAKDGK